MLDGIAILLMAVPMLLAGEDFDTDIAYENIDFGVYVSTYITDTDLTSHT